LSPVNQTSVSIRHIYVSLPKPGLAIGAESKNTDRPRAYQFVMNSTQPSLMRLLGGFV
jgi:hypothetical protein